MGNWALDFVNGVDSGAGGEWGFNVASLTVSVINTTQSSNCQVTTSAPHGLGVGDHVHFRSIVGMVQLNSTQNAYETGTHKRVASVIDSTNFTLDIDSTGFGAYISGGTMHHIGVGRTNPTHVRIPNHSLTLGEVIYVSSVVGTGQVNNTAYKCSNITPNAVQLLSMTDLPINGAGFSPYTSGGIVKAYRRKVIEITKANPAVITVSGHNFTDGQVVFLDGGTMTEISDKGVVVANSTTNTFEANGIDSTSYTTYSGGCLARRPALSNRYLQYEIPSNDIFPTGEEIRVRATTPATLITSTDCTWTAGEYTVTSSSSLVGIVLVGDLIGRQFTGGNGEVERFYKVKSINSTTITLDTRYYGTTGTDVASVYHLPLVSIPTAGLNANYVVYNYKDCHIKGGYNSTYENQTGESWIRHAFSKYASSSNGGVAVHGGTVDRINFLDGYYCLYVTAPSVISNCTFLSSYVYNGYLTAGCSLNKCVIAGTERTSYPSVYQTTASAVNYTDVYVWGATASLTASVAVRLSATGTSVTGTGLHIVCAGRGVNIIGNSIRIQGITLTRCYYNIYCSGSAHNFYIEDCPVMEPVANGRYAYIGSLVAGGTFFNIDFTGQSTLIQLVQTTGVVFDQCTFTNYSVGVSLDQYSGDCIFQDCQFNAPSAFGVSIANATVKNILFRGCTIASGSESRKFNLISAESYVVPNYILDNSFGISGKIYGKLHFISDYSTYYSMPPSLQIAVNTNINKNYRPIEVVSEWLIIGIGRKFKFKIKRDTAVFSGTITPIFYLNGVRKNVLADITSLSTEWTDYEFNCPAASIDVEGHLELMFSIEGTASVFWIDEFNTEDL